jgi:uncharacterized LabA/DUF88 family protein
VARTTGCVYRNILLLVLDIAPPAVPVQSHREQAAPGGFLLWRGYMRVGILVDGGFFLKRYRNVLKGIDKENPSEVAEAMYRMASSHLWRRSKNGKTFKDGELYRLFFYDCPPLNKRAHFPISKLSIDFSKSDAAVFRREFHARLTSMRKVALRLGRLDESNADWQLRDGVLKDLISGKRAFSELTDADFIYYARQKIVDTKIGLDIALLSEKRLVDRIVLIAGDSDFVPAAKHARREGIDFILDPMWNPISPDLHEHIDGLRSTAPNPRKPNSVAAMESLPSDPDEQ